MADYPEVNTLLDGREFTDQMIWDVLDEVISDFNAMPPQIGRWGVADFPNVSMLIDGVIGKLLEQRLPALARTSIDFVAGDVSVRYPQYELYFRLSQTMLTRYRSTAEKYKFSKNIRNAINAATAVPSSNSLTGGNGYRHC